MKKFIIVLVGICLLTGCDTLNNTPTKQVEMMLADYQTLNQDVLDDLDQVVEAETSLVGEQKEDYRKLMKKHYKDLIYDVKDEKIDGDEATVTVEIDVRDYSKILSKANTYLQEHPEKFENDKGEYDASKFMDYRLDKLKEADERVKYTMEIKLHKKDKKWILDDLTEEQEQKIHGVYQY